MANLPQPRSGKERMAILASDAIFFCNARLCAPLGCVCPSHLSLSSSVWSHQVKRDVSDPVPWARIFATVAFNTLEKPMMKTSSRWLQTPRGIHPQPGCQVLRIPAPAKPPSPRWLSEVQTTLMPPQGSETMDNGLHGATRPDPGPVSSHTSCPGQSVHLRSCPPRDRNTFSPPPNLHDSHRVQEAQIS